VDPSAGRNERPLDRAAVGAAPDTEADGFNADLSPGSRLAAYDASRSCVPRILDCGQRESALIA